MRALQYLNKYLKKYLLKLLLGILITIISRVFSLFAPRLIGDSLTAVENYLVDHQADLVALKSLLLNNILIIIGATLLSGFFTFLMRQTIINVSRYIEFDLKNEIFFHYQRLTQRFYKNNRTGDLMSRISEDVSKVRMYVGPAIMYSINTVTLFVCVITLMLSIAPKLSVYTLIPLPLLSLTIYKLSRVINVRSTVVQEMLSKLSSFTQETFSGISVIKSYGLEGNTHKKFDTLALEAKEKNMNLAKVQAWFFPLMILLIGISNLIVIFIGGQQYIDDEIEIGVLAEFIIYINMLTWPVAVVGWVTSVVQQAEASQKRINAFLNEPIEIEDGKGVEIAVKGEITLEDVTLVYPETKIKALDRVSLKLESGKSIGIIGKVGSGKSSILQLINRLYNPNSGKILLDGHDIRDFKLEELRSHIGNVPQNAFLFSESIEDNIRLGKRDASEEEIIEASKKAAIHKSIKKFKQGYQTLLGERGLTLSGGQIQRVSIARALIKNPKILLFDDCLSAVDTDTEEKILKNLKEFSKDKTTIIVSHRISSVKDTDHIIVLDQGKIIEQGKHQKLIDLKGFYFDLFNKQQNEKEY
ncbi:MAG: ABC transporter ATP-binding protein [Flavobacteriaceae bacterium TMED42]|nr:MAG: ABC transporter ATP-binding protein [Flavobacteriaceae bacterium TMED42]|tara:strand:+ start:1092 stop:2846 length:1755 start_codon:yes stop_codon:yes gene_type:complete